LNETLKQLGMGIAFSDLADFSGISDTTPQKVVFRADHPFLFAIRENSTGVVLFMGKIGMPE